MIKPTKHIHLWYFFGKDVKANKNILQCSCGSWKYEGEDNNSIIGIIPKNYGRRK